MEIIYDLWELPKKPQKKILGIGYSSKFLTNEEKRSLSYKMWWKMIHLCYSTADKHKRARKDRRYECCSSWHDYQNFLKWYKENCVHEDGCVLRLTKNVISRDNTFFNPNNCAIVPEQIYLYLFKPKHTVKKKKELAEKYKAYITEDIYELLTEEF